jgi:antitoxin (DNA-binding transcriptional repressor) of toxin-antitoxin stability system
VRAGGRALKTYSVGDLKAKFSSVMDAVRRGEEVGISFGRKKEQLAVIVPYHAYVAGEKRRLGILKGTAKCVIRDDFSLTEDELAGS